MRELARRADLYVPAAGSTYRRHTNKFEQKLAQRAAAWRAQARRRVESAMLGLGKFRAPTRELKRLYSSSGAGDRLPPRAGAPQPSHNAAVACWSDVGGRR